MTLLIRWIPALFVCSFLAGAFVVWSLQKVQVESHKYKESIPHTAKKRGWRFAVLSGTSATLSQRERTSLETNLRAYTTRHNYSVVFAYEPFLEVDEEEKAPPHWHKVAALRRWLPHFDWILWVDHDTRIVDPSRTLDTFIPDPREEYHVVVPQDWLDRREFSNFMFLIRNSPQGHDLLETWWNKRKMPRACQYWGEQTPMWWSLLHFVANATGNVYNATCERTCPVDEHPKGASAIVCFRQETSRLGYGIGVKTHPPVAFALDLASNRKLHRTSEPNANVAGPSQVFAVHVAYQEGSKID